MSDETRLRLFYSVFSVIVILLWTIVYIPEILYNLPHIYLVILGLILFSLIIFGIWLIVKPYIDNDYDYESIENRLQALRQASSYLSPYKNLWGDFRLSNRHCVVTYEKISGIIAYDDNEKVAKRTFRITNAKVYSIDEIWNYICNDFRYNTTYEDLIELCTRYEARIIESSNGMTQDERGKVFFKPDEYPISEKTSLIDANNASEAELTALPGINVIMSKKLIKKREEIGGFKSINDVFLFLHLKEHFIQQLRTKICVKKMKGHCLKYNNSERQIDL